MATNIIAWTTTNKTLSQDQLNQLKTTAAKFGWVESQTFKDLIGKQYGAGAYDVIKQWIVNTWLQSGNKNIVDKAQAIQNTQKSPILDTKNNIPSGNIEKGNTPVVQQNNTPTQPVIWEQNITNTTPVENKTNVGPEHIWSDGNTYRYTRETDWTLTLKKKWQDWAWLNIKGWITDAQRNDVMGIYEKWYTNADGIFNWLVANNGKIDNQTVINSPIWQKAIQDYSQYKTLVGKQPSEIYDMVNRGYIDENSPAMAQLMKDPVFLQNYTQYKTQANQLKDINFKTNILSATFDSKLSTGETIKKTGQEIAEETAKKEKDIIENKAKVLLSPYDEQVTTKLINVLDNNATFIWKQSEANKLGQDLALKAWEYTTAYNAAYQNWKSQWMSDNNAAVMATRETSWMKSNIDAIKTQYDALNDTISTTIKQTADYIANVKSAVWVSTDLLKWYTDSTTAANADLMKVYTNAQQNEADLKRGIVDNEYKASVDLQKAQIENEKPIVVDWNLVKVNNDGTTSVLFAKQGKWEVKQTGSTTDYYGNVQPTYSWVNNDTQEVKPVNGWNPVSVNNTTTTSNVWISVPVNTTATKAIASFEWFRNKAYWDVNWWAIWYGQHSINGQPVQEWDVIDKSTADADLQNRIENAKFNSLIDVELSDSQKAALYSLEHNVWPWVWDFPNGRKIINQINEWDFIWAAKTLATSWIWTTNAATHKVIPSLVNRRKAEADMLMETNPTLSKTPSTTKSSTPSEVNQTYVDLAKTWAPNPFKVGTKAYNDYQSVANTSKEEGKNTIYNTNSSTLNNETLSNILTTAGDNKNPLSSKANERVVNIINNLPNEFKWTELEDILKNYKSMYAWSGAKVSNQEWMRIASIVLQAKANYNKFISTTKGDPNWVKEQWRKLLTSELADITRKDISNKLWANDKRAVQWALTVSDLLKERNNIVKNGKISSWLLTGITENLANKLWITLWKDYAKVNNLDKFTAWVYQYAVSWAWVTDNERQFILKLFPSLYNSPTFNDALATTANLRAFVSAKNAMKTSWYNDATINAAFPELKEAERMNKQIYDISSNKNDEWWYLQQFNDWVWGNRNINK